MKDTHPGSVMLTEWLLDLRSLLKPIIPRRSATEKSVVVDVPGRYYCDLTVRAASSGQMEICGAVRTRAVVVSFSVTFSLQQKRLD